MHLTFFRAYLIIHFNFPNNISIKLRFIEELKSSIIAPCNMKAHYTRYKCNRSKCSCPNYSIFFMCRPKGTFSFRCSPPHSQTKGQLPQVIYLCKPLLIFEEKFIASFSNKDIFTVSKISLRYYVLMAI